MLELSVRGAAELIATLAVAAAAIDDLAEGFEAATRIIDHAQSAGAPRRTGRLAGAMTHRYEGRNSAMLTNPLVYAVPIHWGRPAHSIEANPYVVRAADRTEHMWNKAIEDDAQRTLDAVHGA
jgi:hypothetical protein